MNNELAIIKIGGKIYEINASNHALKRMTQRNVDKFVVAGNVIALGEERISELQAQEDEAIIIDEANNVSVVVGFDAESITIITVINKSNVFVKSNTQIHRI